MRPALPDAAWGALRRSFRALFTVSLQARGHRRNISSDSTQSQGEQSSGSSESDDIQFDLGLSENKKVMSGAWWLA